MHKFPNSCTYMQWQGRVPRYNLVLVLKFSPETKLNFVPGLLRLVRKTVSKVDATVSMCDDCRGPCAVAQPSATCDVSEGVGPWGVAQRCACATAPSCGRRLRRTTRFTCRIVKSAFSHDIAEGSSRVLLHLWVLAIEQTDKGSYSTILH